MNRATMFASYIIFAVACGVGLFFVDKNAARDAHEHARATAAECRALLQATQINRVVIADIVNAVSTPLTVPPGAPETAQAVIDSVNGQRVGLLEEAKTRLNSYPDIDCPARGLP